MDRISGQMQTLAEVIENVAGNDVREQVMAGSETLKASTKPERIALWTQGAIARLDGLVDEAAREQIMETCGETCARINATPIERARARRRKCADLDAFLEGEQKNPPSGMRFSREGDLLYQFYTPQSFSHPMRCYCSLTKGLPAGETMSATYCQCSRAFVQKYWEGILERPVEVDLLETAISGADECKFRIHL